MTWNAFLSQGLLLAACAVPVFQPGVTDAGLAALLGYVVLLCLMNLLESKRQLMHLLLVVHAALCVPFPHFIQFWPLSLYMGLRRTNLALLLALPALSMVYHGFVPSPAGFLGFLTAGLLYVKDSRYQALSANYYHKMDDSSERAMRQQQAISALQREKETGLKLALAQERNRIARDIHDSVGHILSRSILQVTAMEIAHASPEAKQELADLKHSLGEGMNAVRASVHNTRQDSLMLDSEIRALIERFHFCPVHYRNSSTRELSLRQKYVVMSAITEALSNVMRHSNATRVDLTLSFASGSHILLIRDNGTLQKAAEHGLGLSAMEERVKGLGGAMIISAENGFRVLITLPEEERT